MPAAPLVAWLRVVVADAVSATALSCATTVVVMVMVVGRLCTLSLIAGFLLERLWVDTVVLEDLIHRTLNGRSEVRCVAGLFGSLDGVGDCRGKLVL